MSDRFHSLVVVLEKDIKDEDAESIINAIKMTRGVLSVSGEVADMASLMAEERARHELGQKIIDMIYPKRNP